MGKLHTDAPAVGLPEGVDELAHACLFLVQPKEESLEWDLLAAKTVARAIEHSLGCPLFFFWGGGLFV